MSEDVKKIRAEGGKYHYLTCGSYSGHGSELMRHAKGCAFCMRHAKGCANVFRVAQSAVLLEIEFKTTFCRNYGISAEKAQDYYKTEACARSDDFTTWIGWFYFVLLRDRYTEIAHWQLEWQEVYEWAIQIHDKEEKELPLQVPLNLITRSLNRRKKLIDNIVDLSTQQEPEIAKQMNNSSTGNWIFMVKYTDWQGMQQTEHPRLISTVDNKYKSLFIGKQTIFCLATVRNDESDDMLWRIAHNNLHSSAFWKNNCNSENVVSEF